MLLFSGCGIGSLYGPAYYDETSLGNELKRVTFKGGDHPAAGDLCLLRCAEVTREAGYEYFEVVDSEAGSIFRDTGMVYPFHRHYLLDEHFVDDIPFVTKTIRMFKTEPKDDFAYNAIEIERSMRMKYEIK
ncbi:MAG: hypothetical protein VXZ32_02520 [Verrucomicrobiota bacterium]|nr:hypothetical protein [Verrucomicrobiota bacterium]